MNDDVRWKQRFENFERAFPQLKQAVEEYGEEAEPLIKEGIIQHFMILSLTIKNNKTKPFVF